MREKGQGLTEFIVIVVLVALIVLVAVRLFGRSVRCQFSDASTQVDAGSTALGDCPADGTAPAAPPPPPEEPEPPPPAPLPTVPPPPPPPPPTPEPTPTPVPTPEERVFLDPTLAGAPVDVCLSFSKDCGQAAADNFCRISGFDRAKSFGIGPKVRVTYIPGDGDFCRAPEPNPPVCQGFNSVVCVKG